MWDILLLYTNAGQTQCGIRGHCGQGYPTTSNNKEVVGTYSKRLTEIQLNIQYSQ